MKAFQNEGELDRFVRLCVGIVSILGAYFWLGGIVQYILIGVGVIFLITAFSGVCPLYIPFGIRTCTPERKPFSRRVKISAVIVLLITVVAGAYYSAFFSKKFFLNDFNTMNQYYKQTLFYTGQGKRDESIANYTALVTEYTAFEKKYTAYHPYALKADAGLNTDLAKVSDMIRSLKDVVYTGDLHEAHVGFEAVRPIFQDILKRNNISLLSVALVDFHDAMELVIEAADAGNAEEIIAVYGEVDGKLKEVELLAQDAEIQAIRSALDEIRTLAENNSVEALAPKAAELKSAFVKVYLKRG